MADCIMPLREQGFDLNKEQFRDALSLRYNIPLEGLPSILSQLANKLAAKQNESHNTVITWIRRKLSYEISSLLC